MHVGAIVWRQNTNSAEFLRSDMFGNLEFETRKDHILQGNIVNVSSVNGIRSFAGVLAYNISKAALDQLTRFQQLQISLALTFVSVLNVA
jgi:NAD(P)-dependent dehydrogenase (short-subunit alcohol dehydrogenase family)